MTLKEQLDQAEANAKDLQTKLDASQANERKAQQEAKSATERADKAEKAEKEAKDALAAEQKAHGETKQKLEAADKAKTELELKDTSAAAHAAEALAAKGINPPAKGSAAQLNDGKETPTALWERYQNADAVTQATMRDELGDKLEAAAEAWDRAKAGK